MAVKDGRLLEGPLGRGPFVGFETPMEQESIVVAPSAPPELPASEEEQAAADASLSWAPPPAMATAGVGGYY